MRSRPAAALRHRWAPVATATGGAAVILVLLLAATAVPAASLPGLPEPGIAGRWLLPAVRLAATCAAVAAVGFLLAAVALTPRGPDGGLSAVGWRHVRYAAAAAAVWFAAAVLRIPLTLADLLGQPVGRAASPGALLTFVASVDTGQALGLAALGAGTVTVVCMATLTVGTAAAALAVALGSLAPTVFTGHAASATNHQLAVSSMLIHVVAVTLWAGGLLALLVSRVGADADLVRALRRFSRLATSCLAAVAVSGLLSAWLRLPDPGALFGTAYGTLLIFKTVLLGVLALLGAAQRRAAIPALTAGDRSRFRTVAAAELVLFGAALAAATVLARTASPDTRPPAEDLASDLLGYPMPAPVTIGRLASDWLIDPLYLGAALAAAACYLAGVWRLHRRGHPWPAARLACWLAGCAVLVIATCSGIARYVPVLFSINMIQHLLIGMLAPILLVLGAPVTLALRALRAAADPRWPGPREWLAGALHSRYARLVAQPPVAATIFVGSMYVMYLSGWFELTLRSHAAHLLTQTHFLVGGLLFFWAVAGPDPAPRRPGFPARILTLLTAMALHALLGVALMNTRETLAADWFTALARTWGPTALAEQRTAGGIAWSFGEIPGLLVTLTLVRAWIRADRHEAARQGRAADRAAANGEPDATDMHNRMLAALTARDRAFAEAAGTRSGPPRAKQPWE